MGAAGLVCRPVLSAEYAQESCCGIILRRRVGAGNVHAEAQSVQKNSDPAASLVRGSGCRGYSRAGVVAVELVIENFSYNSHGTILTEYV